jgi:hypothetical protein
MLEDYYAQEMAKQLTQVLSIEQAKAGVEALCRFTLTTPHKVIAGIPDPNAIALAGDHPLKLKRGKREPKPRKSGINHGSFTINLQKAFKHDPERHSD